MSLNKTSSDFTYLNMASRMLLVKKKFQPCFNPVEWNNNRYAFPHDQSTLNNNDNDDEDEKELDDAEEETDRKHYYNVNGKNSIKYAPHGLFLV